MLLSIALAQPLIPPASGHRQAADMARRGRDTRNGTPDDSATSKTGQADYAWHADFC